MRPRFRILLLLVFAHSVLCSFPTNVKAQDEPQQLQRGSEFSIFRDTQATLQNGDKRLLRRGKRCRTIDPSGEQLTAFVDGAKVKIDRDDIVYGRSGIRRVTEEINRNPRDWTLRLIRADLYQEAKNVTAALADIDAVPKDAPQFPHAIFARGMLEYQRENWKQMIEDLRECRRLYEAVDLSEGNKERKEFIASIGAWLGIAHHNLGNFTEALTELDAALAGGADTVSTHSWRASALWGLERFDESIKSFRRAVEIDPDDRELWRRLVEGVQRVSGTEAAIAEVTRYVEHAPKSASPLTLRAMVRIQADEFDAAMKDVALALEIDPKNIDAHFAKARALYAGEKWEEIAAMCDDLQELPLTDPKHFAARAMYFQISERDEEALADADKAIELGYRSGRIFLVRAQIYGDRKEWARVLTDTTEAIKLEPRDATAYAWRYGAYLRTNEPELALADINQAITLAPQYSIYYSYRARVLYPMGHHDAGLADLRTAAFLAEDNGAAQASLSQALFFEKRYEECLVVLSELINRESDNVTYYVSRASAWQKRDDLRMAIADLSEALRIKPDDASLFMMRASVQVDCEEMEFATADLASAERIAPLSPSGIYVRGRIQEFQGDYKEAIRTYESILAQHAGSPYGNAGLARVLATAADDQVRDGKKAVEHAANACQVTNYCDAPMIAILAAAHAEVGDFEAAVNWQETANGLVHEAHRSKYAERLSLYKSQKPYRQTPKPTTTAKAP